eukprot:SAG22_NODE_1416_length_4469_cov_3.239930_2_plen_160_part_00
MLGCAMLAFVFHQGADMYAEYQEAREEAAAAKAEAEGVLRTDSKDQVGAEAQKPLGRHWGLPFGVMSGVLAGSLNEGGPPAVIYLSLRKWEKDYVKVGLQAYFLSIHAYSIPLMAANGILGQRHLRYDAIGMPAGFLGVAIGSAVYSRIDSGTFSRLLM